MQSLKVQNDAILSLTRLFTQRLELSSLLERILEVDAATVQVARVSIWLYDPDQNGIELLDLFELTTRTHSRGGHLSKTDYPAYFRAIDDTRILAINEVSNLSASPGHYIHAGRAHPYRRADARRGLP
jgi:hypothetical protein